MQPPRIDVESEGAPAPRTRTPSPAIVRAEDILGADGLLRIDLDGEVYTLRRTRNHKLILTK